MFFGGNNPITTMSGESTPEKDSVDRGTGQDRELNTDFL
jgi:hypothetical protein